MIRWGGRGIKSSQAVEKRPSTAFLSSFVVAAYLQVRLTPQNFEGPRKRDFARLNLYLSIFEQPAENHFFNKLFIRYGSLLQLSSDLANSLTNTICCGIELKRDKI